MHYSFRRCLLQILVVTLVSIGAVFTIIFHVGTREDVSRKRKRPALTENGVNAQFEDSTMSLDVMRWSGWLREHQFYQVCPGVVFLAQGASVLPSLSKSRFLFRGADSRPREPGFVEQTLNRESLGSWSRLSTDRAWVRGADSTDRAWVRGADSQPTEPGFVE